MHDQGVECGALLGAKDPGNGIGIQSIRAQTVHRLSRKSHQPACANHRSSTRNRLWRWVLGIDPEEQRHRSTPLGWSVMQPSPQQACGQDDQEPALNLGPGTWQASSHHYGFRIEGCTPIPFHFFDLVAIAPPRPEAGIVIGIAVGSPDHLVTL